MTVYIVFEIARIPACPTLEGSIAKVTDFTIGDTLFGTITLTDEV